MIEIKNATIVRAGKVLFNNFSWRIQPGEHWILEGPNGSGKTILLEILSGMLHLHQGQIHYEFIKNGSWDERYMEKRRLITYIPAHSLHLLVGGPDLFYQQRYYSIGGDCTPRVKDVLGDEISKLPELHIPDSVSINHLLEVEVHRLSNGQLKKLLLVKSFLKGIPKLLLLDYPFEGLDHQSRRDLSSFIDFVSKRHGVQVIIVDHSAKLPICINRRLTLDNFKIENVKTWDGASGLSSSLQPYLSNPFSNRGGEELIRINNLNLKYGSQVIFRNFDWTVRKGDRWALTGANGAGKTTLFSLIFADHPQAYAQEIFLLGRRRGSGESIWEIKARINYLGPEQISFLDSKSLMLTAYEYIEKVGPHFDKGRLVRMVQHFDAARLIDKKINELSSGELQLLMILICFLSEKELWLMDEPFQFLDPLQKKRLAEYLSLHLSREVTLILITHDDEDIADWTDLRMQLQPVR